MLRERTNARANGTARDDDDEVPDEARDENPLFFSGGRGGRVDLPAPPFLV
jgi:hypothetical protein